jgi:hypothetical protein
MNATNKLVFHILKDTLSGDKIYPLSMLKSLSPEIYEIEIKKYKGREKLMSIRMPYLNCLWNDVIQFSCLDPQLTFREAANFNSNLCGRKIRVFSLDVKKLNSDDACLFTPGDNAKSYNFTQQDFEPFSLTQFESLTEVPAAQIKRWQLAQANNEGVFLFSRTQHLFYKRPVHLSEGQISEFVV